MTIIEEMQAKGIPVVAVTYSRYSSDSQRPESIDAQQRAIGDFAEKNNIIILRNYVDEALSGKSADREEFQKMIDASKSREFNVVLVHKLDRFTRNKQDSAAYGYKLRKNGVHLISVTEYFDNSPESGILIAVIEAMNEFYIKNLSREVKKGLKENALKCMVTGGVAPLGYRINHQTKLLEVDEDESECVKLLFRRVLEGMSYGKIVDEMNSLGYRTRHGNTFSKNCIYDILKNEKYKGVYVYNRSSARDDFSLTRNNHMNKSDDEIIRIEGGVPAIISEKDFDAVQDLLHSRKNMNASNNAIESYLLSGKIFCGICGKSYVGNRKHSGRNKSLLVNYRCNTRGRKSASICDNKEIRKDHVESFVLERLANVIFDDRMIPLLAEKYQEFMSNYSSQAESKIKKFKQEQNNLKHQIENLTNVIASTGNATLVNSLSEKERLLAEIDYKLNQEMETVRTSVLPIDKLKAGLSTAREMFRKGELSETRQLVALYVDKVLVYKDYVEVYLNALPSMSHLTNIKEFITTVSTDSASIKKLLRTDVDRKTLNVDERRKVVKKATPE